MKYSAGINIRENSIKLALISQEGGVAGRVEAALPEGEAGAGPQEAWEAVSSALRELVSGSGVRPEDVISVGATSPPGRVFPADSRGGPLCAPEAVHGQDLRLEVRTICEKCEALIKATGFRFDENSSLAKMLWFRNNRPEIFKRTRRFVHIADFIGCKLTGNAFVPTDTSHALGMGFDPAKNTWHRSLKEIGILHNLLPEVALPGKLAGTVSPEAADECGLSPRTGVTAGTIDRLCLFFSTGPAGAGHWNSHLGEQLIINGTAAEMVHDKLQRIYYHAHPGGGFIACGDSCTGTGFSGERFPEDDISLLAAGIETSGLVIYPVCRNSPNLLPLVLSETEGFIIGRPRDKQDLFSGYAEGAACVEKWIYEMLEKMGIPVGDTIWATGETSGKWLKARADIVEKTFVAPAEPTAEFGMALLGLSGTLYGSFAEAAKEAVRVSFRAEPQTSRGHRGKYRKFRQACKAVGYE